MIYFSKNTIAIESLTVNHRQPNFRFEAEVFVDGDSMLSVRGKSDKNGVYTFDLHELLHCFLEPAVPALNNFAPQLSTGSIKTFQVKLKEFYGEPYVVQQSVETLPAHKVLMGGLKMVDFPQNGSLFFSSLNNRWLTWQPVSRKILPDSPEYLYYLELSQATGNRWAHYRLYKKDGTYKDYSKAFPEYAAYGQIFVVPANIFSVFDNLDNPAGAPVAADTGLYSHYTLHVSADSAFSGQNNISEVRTFLLDHSYYPHKRFFLYHNSLSGFDTLCCRGNFQGNVKVDRTQAERVLGPYYTGREAAFFSYNQTWQESIKANTGYLTAEELRYTVQFLVSESVFEVDNGQLLPVQIATSSARHFEDEQNRLSLEFEYMPAFKNSAYSRIR